MVIVAELVKRLIVVQEIVGSSPTLHTECACGGMVDTLDLKSNPQKWGCRFESGLAYQWKVMQLGVVTVC